MMNGIFKIDLNVLRRGDKTIWGVVALLLGFALLGVISTSTISEVKSISSVFLIVADKVVGHDRGRNAGRLHRAVVRDAGRREGKEKEVN